MDTDDSRCANVKHPQHLCSLARRGCTTDIDRLEENPRYVCENCGRKAHAAENLCTPRHI